MTELGRIEIIYAIDDEGDMPVTVEVKGDIPFVTQLGLLEMAKDWVLNGSYEENDE